MYKCCLLTYGVGFFFFFALVPKLFENDSMLYIIDAFELQRKIYYNNILTDLLDKRQSNAFNIENSKLRYYTKDTYNTRMLFILMH